MSPLIPQTYEEAISGPFSAKWKEAINAKLEQINEKNSWEIVLLPNDIKPTGCK